MVRLLLTSILICLTLIAEAQNKGGYDNNLKGIPFKERIVTGGGLGLSFGSTQDFISVSTHGWLQGYGKAFSGHRHNISIYQVQVLSTRTITNRLGI